MTRSREWKKFGTLAAISVMLGIAFLVAVNSALPGRAQVRPPLPIRLNTNTSSQSEIEWRDDLSTAFTRVSEVVRPAVVYISSSLTPSARGPRQGSGSGFIFSPDGYIITNNHVVENAEHIVVSLFDRRQFPARLIGRDQDTDIAVLKIDVDDPLPSATLGNSDSVRVGEWVLAIGNPLNRSFAFTVTAGIVSAKGRLLQGLQNSNYAIHDFIQTDAAINPGNSGGPLINIRGEVVGVNSALISATGTNTGYGFAIPINLARRVTEMLLTEGRVTRSLLGVSIQDATPEDAAFAGLDSIYGVTIQSFSGEHSPAERAGLELGDLIVALDGDPVLYMAQLQQEVGFKNPGDVVTVTVRRAGGATRNFRVRLTEADLTPAANNPPLTATAPVFPDQSGTGLGISVETIAAARGRQRVYLAVPPEYAGPVVVQIPPQGPSAERLRGGDIITHVDGQRVRTPEQLREKFENKEPGQIVTLQAYRLQVLGDSTSWNTAIARVRLAEPQ
ncbi:MAG: trypsin-like peptidase domain-containing protein [Gemmatimonadetes bacterium]|nr:trypsin-like peptidase domain-containing protein [Gemmatimonadota bacterium]